MTLGIRLTRRGYNDQCGLGSPWRFTRESSGPSSHGTLPSILVRSGKRSYDYRQHSQRLAEAHIISQNTAKKVVWGWTFRSSDDVLITAVRQSLSMITKAPRAVTGAYTIDLPLEVLA
jgi:hypothetical protein